MAAADTDRNGHVQRQVGHGAHAAGRHDEQLPPRGERGEEGETDGRTESQTVEVRAIQGERE